MSASPRRLALGLLVALLALPASPVAAVPFDTGVLLAKLRGLLSFVWAENGCELDPLGRCGAAVAPNDCEIGPSGHRGASSTLVRQGSQKPVLNDNGCVIDPLGRCEN